MGALGATLLGTAVPSGAFVQAWRAFEHAGIDTIARAADRGQAERVAFICRESQPRGSQRAARRLSILAAALAERDCPRIASLGEALENPH